MNSYEQRRRRAAFDRMLRRLREGVPASRISGDRDVLQAAVETFRREQKEN